MDIDKRLEDLENKIKRLEEKIDLTIDKQGILNLVKEQKRLLHSEYGSLLYNLKKEFNKYDPKIQANIKKIVLMNLPDKPTFFSHFLLSIEEFLKAKKLDHNMAELEIFLVKLGAIKNNLIYKGNIDPNLLETLLEML